LIDLVPRFPLPRFTPHPISRLGGHKIAVCRGRR